MVSDKKLCCDELLARLVLTNGMRRFLLKYVSRDEVDLLGRGNGGIVEIRNAITKADDGSPLFGFLRYRRRNVLIKYVPESCSRLVQGWYLARKLFGNSGDMR
jgi:hypothetical protein